MERIIIHVDMDAFFAAVEIRDNPGLKGKPLIVGALPHERGVVSTCSYEAREFGVRSGISVKEAYRLCPQGIYMHPNMSKYKEVSDQVHQIWSDYTDIIEYISLDEGYLDISGGDKLFGGAANIGCEIKRRTLEQTGLTCSVGIGYSMMTAKLASEEKKPDGFFEIPNAEFLQSLIIDRDIRVIYGIGKKTADKLHHAGIHTVRDLQNNAARVIKMLGKQGQQIVDLAHGIDERQVTASSETEAKSISREQTFQRDITDSSYLKKVLLLLAKDLSLKMQLQGIFARTITLKVTYYNLVSITRSKSGEPTNSSADFYKTAANLLDGVDKKPIRLVGIGLSGLTDNDFRQLSLDDIAGKGDKRKKALDSTLLNLQKKFGAGIIKTGLELEAEQSLKDEE